MTLKVKSGYAPAPNIDFNTPPDEFNTCRLTTDLSWSCPTASSAILDSSIESFARSLPDNAPGAIIELVIVFVSADVISVPVISGIVIVLFAVGSVAVTVVLNVPAVEPSNSTELLKRGTASKVNALPAAEEVNLGILEFSSTLNNPLPVSNSLTLNVSKTESVLVSTDLILFPLNFYWTKSMCCT